jgi:aminotransferase
MPRNATSVDNIIEAMSIKYNNRVYDMQSRGIDVTTLSYGEAYFDIPLYPFDDLPYPALYHYSHSRGTLGLRELLSQYYAKEYSVPVDPETEIIITAGSKIAIYMALTAILDPGDEVIICEPAWVSYSEQTLLCHAVPVRVPYYESARDVARYVTDKTKVIILNNPVNPTGKELTHEELDSLHALAEQRDIYLLVDEAYSDYVFEAGTFLSIGAGDPGKKHTIICNSMSKNYGISGWRIGYVIANPDLTFQILKVNQHLITCPATILEFYLEKHFSDIIEITRPQIREVVEKRNKVGAFVDDVGLKRMPGTGTFYLFISIEESSRSSEAFSDRLLEEYHVSTVAGIGYGKSCDKFVRVSVGTESMERTQDGIRSIQELLAKTSS